MTKNSQGRIIIPESGNFLEAHELMTAEVFRLHGKDVEFIKPSRIKGSRSPDVKIEGRLWEIKSPIGKSKKTVSNALRRAVKQSSNIIIDGRRMRLGDDDIEAELKRNIPLVRSLKRLIQITKSGEIIVLK